ncbi:hypothetical protein ACHAQJ_005954 [Trichoderma viride]
MGASKWLRRIPLLLCPGLVTLPKFPPPVKRICVITSSSEDDIPIFKKHGDFPDPSRYIPTTRHEFVVRRVALNNAKAEIDKVVNEGFDFYLNYMCGGAGDAKGLEATRYLESKGASILNNSFDFLKNNDLDSLRAANDSTFCVPQDIAGKYPKIVRFDDGCSSLDLDVQSLCNNEEEVNERLSYLKQQNDPLKISVHDHMIGDRFSVTVLEMGRKVVSLTPLQFSFPLEGVNGHSGAKSSDFTSVQDERRKKLQEAAEQAFKAVNGAGFARVDMCAEEETGDVYVLGVVSNPLIFFPPDNKFGDDDVIGSQLGGGHASFIDVLIATKRIQLSSHQKQDTSTAEFFDSLAPQYDKVLEAISFGKIHSYFAQKYDFSGTVLDVACGTGSFGKALADQAIKAELTGIELSPGMAASPYAKKYYKQPVKVGPMQELTMQEGEYDHVVCLGSLHLVDAIDVTALLTRMFMLARKAVSFDIDDLDEQYCGFFQKWESQTVIYPNIIATIRAFGVPEGWKQVEEEKHFLSKHPVKGTDVYHVSFRFERV